MSYIDFILEYFIVKLYYKIIKNIFYVLLVAMANL